MKVLTTLILCLAFPVLLCAQSRRVGGTVVGDDAPLEAVSVCLLDADSSIVQFTQTDAAGRWQLEAGDRQEGFVSFSYLGFAKQVIPLAQCHEGMQVRLQEAAMQIREVSVRGDRIWQRGDTLTYSVAGFRLPQDRTIEDVLKKIPGIEVSANGQISFQDQPINKFYVEGMDLLGSKYALASRNMPAQMVRNVQVLQNHQPVAALRGKSFSDNAALNLVLEDEARHRLIGIIDMGLGADADGGLRWENRLMGMLFGRRMQNLTMYKNSNTGADLAEEINPLAVGMGSLSAGGGREEDFFSASPSVVRGLDRERYLDNNAHLAAVNHLYKPSPTRDLRLQLTALHDEQDAAHGDETTYYYPSETVTVREEEDYHAQENRLDAELGYQRNDTAAYIKNTLQGTLSLHKRTLSLLTNGTALQQRIRPQRKSLRNDFELIRNRGIRSFSLCSANAYSELPQRLLVTPGPYEDLLNGGQGYGVLEQSALLRAFTSDWETYFQHRVAGFYLKYRTGVSYANRSLQSGLAADGLPVSGQEYANHLRLQTVEAYVEPSLNLKREYWDVQLRVPLAWQFALLEMRLPQSLSQRTHRLMPTPSLQVKHRLSAMWEINLSSSLTFIKPEIQQLYAGYLFRSYRSAQAYDPQLSYDKAWQSRVMLRFNNPLRGLFLSLSGFATRLWRETLYQYENREGYLSVGHVLHRPHTGLSAGASVRLSKAFDWKRLYVALSGSYLRNHNKLMLEEEWAESRMSTASVSAQVTMEPARFLNFEGNTRASLRRSELIRANALPASTAWSYEHSLDVNVVFSKAWQWQLCNRVTHDNRNREATYFMDASLSYTRERWMLRLEGHNLLNRTRVSAIYLSDYTRQLAVNDLRPLEVLLKVNFSF